MSSDLVTGNGYQPIDVDRLPELEAVIARGLSTFLEVGRALLEIRDGKLYAADYRTFEDYCAGRWNLTRARGYQLIDAARVVDAVSTVVDVEPPRSERVARELAETLHNDGPDAAAEMWERAGGEHGPQPTAPQVRETVRGASAKPSRAQIVLALADGQRAWASKLRRYIEHELGDDPLPEQVRRQIAAGALQRAHATVTVLQSLVDGEPPDLDVLDATPKFAEEAI